jgi:glycosyltransferase involved in cell wall biosynthesis
MSEDLCPAEIHEKSEGVQVFESLQTGECEQAEGLQIASNACETNTHIQSQSDLISVIVPVYEVEKYLDRCVESLISQTYKNLEIILVDDGSPDECGKLCDIWATRDARISVIHKQNGGLSDARNVGAAAAKGLYIGFVDSDDYISPSMYESLLSHIQETGAGLAICGVADVYSDHTDKPSEIYKRTMRPEEVLSDIFLNKTLMVGVPPRLYPAKLAKEVISPVGKTHEDAFTVVEYLSKVSLVAVDTTPLYFYCHNEGTITSNPKTRARMDNIEAWEHNRKLVEEHFPQIMNDVMFRCYWAHFDVLDGIVLSGTNTEHKQEIIDWLKAHKREILKHPNVNTKRKIAIRALCLSEAMYEKLVHAQNDSVHYN